MTLIKNSAEGGTNLLACTQGSGGNTGGTSGRYFDTVSIAGSSAISFSNEQAKAGSLSYKLTTSGADAQYLAWVPGAAAAFAARGYLYLPALPSAGNGFINLRTAGGGTPLGTVVITNARVEIQNAAGAQIWNSGSVTVPTGQWLRWEIRATNGNVSTGTFNMDWYVGDSNTPISGLTAALTAQNLGTSNFGQIRIGRTAAFGTWQSFYMDGLAYDDGATDYIGPDSNTPPTVDAGSNQNVDASSTVNLHGTASDPDGAISEVEWTVVSPSTGTPTIADDDTLDASFTAGSAGNLYTVQLEATDNDGATATDTVEVRVPVASGTSMRPLALDGTGTGAWTIGGGSGTHGAALADDSDSTYVESPAVSASPSTLRVRLQPSAAKSTGQLKERIWTDTGTADAVLRLYEGNTLRQTWTAVEVDDTPTEYTFDLDSGTVGAISDWGNLYVELSVTE